MLTNVHIKNLALIEEAEIDFQRGLNIMTGETGAGKSIIIGAINLALGEKANKSMIRTGSASALVELGFRSSDPNVFAILDNLGIDRDGENITITRKISQESSVSKINGESVTLANLKRVTSLLVDIHGQHDHQSLLNPARHMEILDDFAGAPVKSVKAELSSALSSYRRLREEFKKYDLDQEALARELSLAEYEAGEIESAELVPGEDGQLQAAYAAMSKAEKTSDILNKILYSFSDEAAGISNTVSLLSKDMEDAFSIDPDLWELKSSLTDIDSIIKDFSRDLSRYVNENSFDREAFHNITERLNLINRLKNKYGSTIEDILSYGENCRKRLDEAASFEENKERLHSELNAAKSRINALAKELSDRRKAAAARLTPLITDNLKDLNFLNVHFEINFTLSEKISASGFDRVRFLISLNPGEPLKPLDSVASGGELSRIMLALKSALAENDRIETLIFDEIDTGISGNTAAKVSDKLRSLSQGHQIICITHLPQIAARADHHFLIEKAVSEGSTITGIRPLGPDESIGELAKMISGTDVTPAALEHAKELKGLG